MRFIVVFTALLIERFFDWSYLRHWGWYTAWQQRIAQKCLGQSSYFILALSIVPLLIVMCLVDYLLKGWWYGLAELLFQFIVVLYCFGPRNLWVDAFACMNGLATSHQAPEEIRRTILSDQIFIEANKRIFAVVFWYTIFGVIGAVLYRLLAQSAQGMAKREVASDVTQRGYWIEALLDWLPIRVFTFIFALGGHCVRVLSCWGQSVFRGLASNDAILTECGVAALGCDVQEQQEASLQRSVISLLDRVFVIALVIVAVVVLLV